ncbi:MAG: hypothetical protein JSW07_05520, partial [bacterium]
EEVLMSSTGSIQWGRILLSAFLAAIIAMALIVLVLWILGRTPSDDFYGICPPDIVDDPDTGSIIGDIIVYIILFIIVCTFRIVIYALIIYFPLAAIISIFLIIKMVQHRRSVHIILTVLISFPIAFAVLWLISRIFS